MDEIRLSFAGERFHLEHEVIALIEVAFITLPYYMLGRIKNETRAEAAVAAAPTRCTYTLHRRRYWWKPGLRDGEGGGGGTAARRKLQRRLPQ